MSKSAAEFDLVLYGASGFTGALVAEYLARAGQDVRWAIGGRDAAKLGRVAAGIGLPELPVIVADADDVAALDALVARTRLVLSTAGPYQFHGSPLVAACVVAGVDYVNLSGEPIWARETVERHHDAAIASGARILLSCGFDSIPSELGTIVLQAEAARRWGRPAAAVSTRVRAFRGSLSGGTVASGRATMALARDPAVRTLLLDSFALTPGFAGPPQPPMHGVRHDDALGVWLTPFVMASVNTKNVHRSHLLMGQPYGADFRYDEMLATGPGDAGKAAAEKLATIDMVADPRAPKPGEGPSREEREAGFYDLLVYAHGPDGDLLKLAVHGDMDPGYGSTAKLVSETALLLLERPGAAAGVSVPGAALGVELAERLAARAGLTFTFED